MPSGATFHVQDWPEMKRRFCVLAACLVLWLTGTAAVQAQAGFDRPGGDYANAAVRSGDPNVCAARCERDSKCRAWSFSYPRTAGRDAICWLKSQVTPVKEDSCCVSGVRGAAVVEARAGNPEGNLEYAIDRFGGDFRNIELPADPTGKACADACQADPKCRAFTYVRPGYIGQSARCFLKDRITKPRRKPCCISGVVR
jgi:hypothetical protein